MTIIAKHWTDSDLERLAAKAPNPGVALAIRSGSLQSIGDVDGSVFVAPGSDLDRVAAGLVTRDLRAGDRGMSPTAAASPAPIAKTAPARPVATTSKPAPAPETRAKTSAELFDALSASPATAAFLRENAAVAERGRAERERAGAEQGRIAARKLTAAERAADMFRKL